MLEYVPPLPLEDPKGFYGRDEIKKKHVEKISSFKKIK
jgi:hypothetical protein